VKRIVARDWICGNADLKAGTVLDPNDPKCPLEKKLFYKFVEALTAQGIWTDPGAAPPEPPVAA